jgi:predicted amidophosphoribosyltransferase
MTDKGPKVFGICSGCGQPLIYEDDLATRCPDCTYPEGACPECGLLPPKKQLDFRPFIG